MKSFIKRVAFTNGLVIAMYLINEQYRVIVRGNNAQILTDKRFKDRDQADGEFQDSMQDLIKNGYHLKVRSKLDLMDHNA